MKILKIIYYFREKWEMISKKDAKLLQKFVCPIFDLFYYCLQNVQNIFWKYFNNSLNKIVFQIPVKMSESENEYGGKETSDEAKVEYKKDPVTG